MFSRRMGHVVGVYVPKHSQDSLYVGSLAVLVHGQVKVLGCIVAATVTAASACVVLLALLKCWTVAYSLLDWYSCVIPTYGKSQHRVARFQHLAGVHGSMRAGDI